MQATETTFLIRAYSKKELRQCYGVSEKTFRTWLNKIPSLGDYSGKAYTPYQVNIIITHLGTP